MAKNVGFRQGDVLITPVDDIPANLAEVAPRNGRLIVAEGEATGHHHSFPHQRGATLFRANEGESGGALYAVVTAPVALEHQEHGPHTLTPGKYRLSIQRTYQAGMARRVED